MLADAVREALGSAAGLEGPVAAARVGGAAGKTLWRISTTGRSLFVKVLPGERGEELRAEADGLEALRRAGAVAVPAVHAVGLARDEAYLALDWLDLASRGPGAQERLGAALARQHRSGAAQFGYTRDNYIGPTPQSNGRRHDWLEFLRDERLGPQLGRAAARGLPPDCTALGRELLERLADLLADHRPAPALLHGDLWAGNWGATADETPWVFDPAVYFGDREADLAMTRLFGGFGPAFYRGYEAEWPLDPGAERRVDMYNAYHLLNHFNLFGAAYLPPLRESLQRALAFAARQPSSR